VTWALKWKSANLSAAARLFLVHGRAIVLSRFSCAAARLAADKSQFAARRACLRCSSGSFMKSSCFLYAIRHILSARADRAARRQLSYAGKESFMSIRNKTLSAIVLFVAALAAPGMAFAQKSAVPRVQDKLALGADAVKQLLLLMDTDKNGRISRQEWMNFTAAEFDRLDADKSGELDVKEIAQSKLRASHPVYVGK
jgi:hypothetical protein